MAAEHYDIMATVVKCACQYPSDLSPTHLESRSS
jgi:hypothetical protein